MFFLAGVRGTVPAVHELDSGLLGRGRDSCSQAQHIVKSSHAFDVSICINMSICFMHLDCAQVSAAT